MHKLIVYVDDAAHAMGVLQPLLVGLPGPRQWILVGCAPRVTHHVSKWVTHSARESWRSKWADKLFAQVVPVLQEAGDEVLTLTGKHNLQAQTELLQREHGQARVIDARRPKLGPSGLPLLVRPAPGPSLLSTCMTVVCAGLMFTD